MAQKPKFSWAHRQQWAVKKREETYASAERKALPSAERRSAEQAAISEFIKKRGVRRIPASREA
jgi:hypothetical protein